MTFENSLHYVTFADRTQVENRTNNYNSLILQSHLLVGGQKAVTSLLNNLIDKEDIEYYVDPAATHFHRGRNFRNEDDSLRAWHSKLIEELGPPFTELANERRNLAFSELNDTQRDQAIDAVCDLQYNFVAESIEENLGKYETVNTEQLTPKAIIPWYSKITNYRDLSENRNIIESTRSYADSEIKPCIHVTTDFISDVNGRVAIADVLSNLSVESAFIWIDDLDKSTTGVREYYNTIDLVAKISEEGIDPHFLYGDFFSALLFFFGLRGTGYGTYYLESSTEKLESGGGGGGNLKRFYFDPVKDFLTIPDTIAIAIEQDEALPPFTPLSAWEELFKAGDDHDFLKNHFIKTKQQHKFDILGHDIDSILDHLQEDYEKYSEILANRDTVKSAEHLNIWIEAIQRYRDENSELSDRLIEEAETLQFDNNVTQTVI